MRLELEREKLKLARQQHALREREFELAKRKASKKSTVSTHKAHQSQASSAISVNAVEREKENLKRLSRQIEVVRDPVDNSAKRPRKAAVEGQAMTNPFANRQPLETSSEDDADFTERFSQLRLKSRLISSAVVDERMKDSQYIPLNTLGNHARGQPIQGKWIIVGVVIEVILRTTKTPKANKFGIIKLGDLDSTVVNVLLFGEAYEKFWNELPGTVIAIVTPDLLRATSTDQADGVKISHPDHVLRLGKSKDMGYCSGTRKDGIKCTMSLNLRFTEYCDFHISQAVRKVAMNRPEFLNDQTRRQIAQGKDKRKAQTKKTHGVYFTEGQLISTNVPVVKPGLTQRPEDKALLESTISRSNFGADIFKRMQGAERQQTDNGKKQKISIGSQVITTRSEFRNMFQVTSPEIQLSSDHENSEAVTRSTRRASAIVKEKNIQFQRIDPNRPLSKPISKTLSADIERRKQIAAQIKEGPKKRNEDLYFNEREEAQENAVKETRNLATKFNIDLDKEKQNSQAKSGRPLMSDLELKHFYAKCKQQEFKEKHLEKMDKTYTMQVTGYSCRECGVTSDKILDNCKQMAHQVSKVPNCTKRFFRCTGCPSVQITTLNSTIPKQRCRKCGECNWRTSSMLRTAAKTVGLTKPLTRGVEQGKFLQ